MSPVEQGLGGRLQQLLPWASLRLPAAVLPGEGGWMRHGSRHRYGLKQRQPGRKVIEARCHDLSLVEQARCRRAISCEVFGD